MPSTVPPEGRLAAIFRHVERRRCWTMPRRLRVVALCGQVDLDFREAIVAPGESELVLSAWLSQLDLVAPPWLRIEAEPGLTIDRPGPDAGPAAGGPALAVVRITGSIPGSYVRVRPAPPVG